MMLKRLASEPDAVDGLVQKLRVLADATRLRLLAVLQGGERNVSSLCEELELPQPTVSHHLGLLRQSRLVTNRRDGKQIFYSLNGEIVSNLALDGGVNVAGGPIDVRLISTPDPAVPVPDDEGAAAVAIATHDGAPPREAKVPAIESIPKATATALPRG